MKKLMKNNKQQKKIAVLIPCLNEELTIANVIRTIKSSKYELDIFVYDNGSSDSSVTKARDAGAEVTIDLQRGKAHLIKRMFSDIEADIYIMVDSDGEVDLSRLDEMLKIFLNQSLSMLVAKRSLLKKNNIRPGHIFGNRLLNFLVRFFYGKGIDDCLSGFRILSRQFVKSFPVNSKNFEIEMDISIHALELNLAIANFEVDYFDRVADSKSKVHTIKDGFSILSFLGKNIFKSMPGKSCGFVSILSLIISIYFFIPIYDHILQTGEVVGVPTLIYSAAFLLASVIFACIGLILRFLNIIRIEQKKLHFLNTHNP